jgi:hypothetical protein
VLTVTFVSTLVESTPESSANSWLSQEVTITVANKRAMTNNRFEFIFLFSPYKSHTTGAKQSIASILRPF